jgi:polyhydroxyalkanoate synthase
VRKFALFGAFTPGSDEARRFVALEDWANEGEPLPLPAARELFELYRNDAPGGGHWEVGGRTVGEKPPVPALHFVAGEDRIVPAASAPEGNQLLIASGHVGMIVGRARSELHRALADFLAD